MRLSLRKVGAHVTLCTSKLCILQSPGRVQMQARRYSSSCHFCKAYSCVKSCMCTGPGAGGAGSFSYARSLADTLVNSLHMVPVGMTAASYSPGVDCQALHCWHSKSLASHTFTNTVVDSRSMKGGRVSCSASKGQAQLTSASDGTPASSQSGDLKEALYSR